MLPLAGPPFPDSAESLAQALRDGLARHGLAAQQIDARGSWPALGELRLDFTGTRLTRAQRLPGASAPLAGRVEAAEFTLAAAPLHFEQTPIDLSLRATQTSFGFAQSADSEPLLVLEGAEHGELALEIRREALEALLQSVAAKAAGEHGVEVKKTRLELVSRSPRELAFRAEVTAKMFIVTAAITLSGEVTVDDQLDARLTNLRFSGEGMIANAAGGFIRPQLEKLEGRTFSLLALSLGRIKLRDVQLAGGDSLRLTTQFGDA